MRCSQTVMPLGLVAAVLLAGCGADAGRLLPTEARVASLGAAGATTHRPIEEFVAAQGVYCASPEHAGGPFCPNAFPGEDVISWFDPVRGVCGTVDYPGVADRYLAQASGGARSLGTTFSGTVSERALADGRAEVSVRLSTASALAFAQSCDGAPFSPLMFGARPSQVLGGAAPALASSVLDVTFISPAPGLPLPALVQIVAAETDKYELVSLAFHARADGVLHAASGLAEGTSGVLWIQQLGRINPGLQTRPPQYPGDVFPVETVSLRPVGQ